MIHFRNFNYFGCAILIFFSCYALRGIDAMDYATVKKEEVKVIGIKTSYNK